MVKDMEGKWTLGRGDTAAFNPREVGDIMLSKGTVSGQYKMVGTCVFMGPCAAFHTVLKCGKTVISLG